VELKQALVLAAILGTEVAPAQDHDQRIRPLELRKLPVLAPVIGKLVIGERRSRNDVGSHGQETWTELLGKIQGSSERGRARCQRWVSPASRGCGTS